MASEGAAMRRGARLLFMSGTLAPIHNRMPVIMERDNWPLWLGETEGDALALLRPAGADTLRTCPVSRAVNSVRNNGPDLLA